MTARESVSVTEEQYETMCGLHVCGKQGQARATEGPQLYVRVRDFFNDFGAPALAVHVTPRRTGENVSFFRLPLGYIAASCSRAGFAGVKAEN